MKRRSQEGGLLDLVPDIGRLERQSKAEAQARKLKEIEDMEYPQAVPLVVNPNNANPIPLREHVQAAGNQPRAPPLAHGAAQADI
ncbi:unnamed protein product [Arabis nemorensis]|uniref:Uncharacterized protein n=1 Tax=Arabis nemorensis TaxID=586526 RepID=A0A565BAH6_9BRAS|nr:unnamed protein product [Arabis nemorensis]